MTTTLAPTLPLTPTAADRAADRPLRWRTLFAVELRKMVDTRSGLAIVLGTLAASAAVLVRKLAASSVETSFHNYSGGVATMVAFALPVVGLLAMTAEWTQRTALTTFTLAPRRLPVFAAKYAAAITLSLATIGVALVAAGGATALGGALHGGADLSGWLGDVRYAVVLVVLQVTMAAALGALAGHTPVALAAFLVAPTAWAAVASAIQPVAQWFDIFAAYGRLASDAPLAQAGPTLTSVAVWVVLPTAIGLARSLRRDAR